jgi:hypothetical protein
MKKLLLPFAATALLAGIGAASASEPTKLDAAALDNVTAGWSQSDDRNRRDPSNRSNQENKNFLSPQVNVAALNNVSVLSSGSQSVGQSNSNSNFSFQR